MDALRTPRALLKALPAAKGLPFLLAIACSSADKHPPELGDCIPADDASCFDPGAGAVGAVLPIDSGGQITMDTGATTEIVEGGSCGQADTFISSPCAPCIMSLCCLADTACSMDQGCLQLVSCAVNGLTCTPASLAATQAYDDLQGCFVQFCTQQCLSISPRDL